MLKKKASRQQSALVVERSIAKRSLLVELLKELGFAVVIEAPSASAALECMDMAVFDAIFVEVISSRDGHFQFIRRLRTDRTRNTCVPIIVVSAISNREVLERTRDAGASGFLARPFSRGSLQLQLVRISNDRRVFVSTDTFAGPDRRRWNDPSYAGPERRRRTTDVHID